MVKGRKKETNNKLEEVGCRFAKRRTGLIKKAKELAILCGSEIGLIIFSSDGKVYDYSTSTIEETISKYKSCKSTLRPSVSSVEPPESDQKQGPSEDETLKEEEALKEEIEKLKNKQMQLLGKDLSSMNLNELQKFDFLLNEGLLAIKDMKDRLRLEQLEQSKMQEQQVLLENETLRKQVAELQGLIPLAECAQPAYQEFLPMQTKTSNENAEMITTLQLMPPSQTSDYPHKRNASEGEEEATVTISSSTERHQSKKARI